MEILKITFRFLYFSLIIKYILIKRSLIYFCGSILFFIINKRNLKIIKSIFSKLLINKNNLFLYYF